MIFFILLGHFVVVIVVAIEISFFRNSNFDKSVVRAFHAAGYIFEVLNNFGELGEETLRMSKYAKWKAAYIHKWVNWVIVNLLNNFTVSNVND